jgi:ABC-type branched-subunit amino acid transport system ATPase component/ABC-type branched-subunit amino acid transport system permease subunit
LVVVQQVFWPAPFGVLCQGVIIGSLTAMIAIGLCLIYRASRIVSFAQADLGAVPTVFTVVLITSVGLPYVIALPIGIVIAVVLGIALELIVIRRFAKAPRLILTVATIGLAQALTAVALAIPGVLQRAWPGTFGHKDLPATYPSPFHLAFEVGPVTFGGNDVIAVATVIVSVLAVAGFLRFTAIGIAVRASAEDADRALLLGIPVRRVRTTVWAIASVLAFLSVFLRAGVIGLPLGSVLGPAVLVRALAACVVGGMERLTLVFAASVALGVVEQAIVWDTGGSTLVAPILFLVVLLTLLVQRRSIRARTLEQSHWQAVTDTRPVPNELRRLPEVRWVARALTAASVAIACAAPLVLPESRVNLLGVILIYAMVAVSLVVLTGWAGQVSLGQVAFLGIGAAVGGWVTSTLHWDLAVALVIAGLVGGVIAMVIGLPALRIRGMYLAVTTLAFAQAASLYLLNQGEFGWLPTGRLARAPVLGLVPIKTEAQYYYFILTCLLLVIVGVRRLRVSRVGRVLIGVRDNERAAQAYGVNATRAKLTAFAVSGAIAAFAGGVFVHHQQSLGVQPYATEESLAVFAMVVIGGLGSLPGALIGAAYIEGAKYFLSTELAFFTGGLGLLIVLMALPGGLGGAVYQLRDRYLRWVANRRNVLVPSLVADARGVDAARPSRSGRRRARSARAVMADVWAERQQGRAPLLVVKDLDVRYDAVQVLFGVDFEVAEGDLVALLGTNGAGKSTLLKAVSGLLEPSAGAIVFDGSDLTRTRAEDVVVRGVVQVPGGRGVFPSLTVAENMRLAVWPRRKDAAYVEEATAQVLGFFPVLRERWEQPGGNLSGGEQQMLTLGMAFLSRPRLLMIDELSLGLAPVVVEQLLEIVGAIRARGTAIILVEQSVNVALRLADNAYFLEKGEVRFHGPTRHLLDRPDILRAVFLGDASTTPVDRDVPDRRAPDSSVPDRGVPDHAGDAVLEAIGLTRSFGGVRALSDATFSVKRGEILGVIGPNGAGKTTLFDLLSGYLPPDHGRLWLEGRDITRVAPDARAWLGLGRSFQDARLFAGLTVAETIALALERQVEVRDPFAIAAGLPGVRQSQAVVARRAAELIELVGLGAFRAKFIRELSTGTRRLVDLCCLLAHEPVVMLLDEPSAGIAQREAEALAPMLVGLRDAIGATMIVIEHDMPLVTAIADELLALDLGEIVTRGPAEQVLHHPRVVASYLGTSVPVTLP